MAFSLEAAVTVPLVLTLFLQPAALAPDVAMEPYNQAKAVLHVVKEQVNPPHFYQAIKEDDAALTTVLASPQLMLEVIGLAKDAWQPISRLLGP